MRPVSVFANGPASEIEKLQAGLSRQWRQATRAVMVLAGQPDHHIAGPPGLVTLPRIRRCLGWPQVSMRTLYRRVRLVAIWRRPKLTARGDPDHDHAVAQIVARLIELHLRVGG